MPYKNKSHAERMKESRGPAPDDRRHAAARGYDYKWTKARKMQLRREPLCQHCTAAGFTEPAVLVDHIVPLSQGGASTFDNLESLCTMHHNKKTAAERQPTRGAAPLAILVALLLPLPAVLMRVIRGLL